MKKAGKHDHDTSQKRRPPPPAVRKRQRAVARERADRETTAQVAQLLTQFPDEAAARTWLEEIRWPWARWCPACSSPDTTAVPQAEPMPYWCPSCRTYFSVRTGTPLQHSRLPLRLWVIALFLMTMEPTGVSARQLHRALGIAQSSAWFLGWRIRTTWEKRRKRTPWNYEMELWDSPGAGAEKTPGWAGLPKNPKVLARALL